MKNLFGKTLVVLIFMFSLMLLVMSGAIYMTHTDWRDRAEKLTKEVEHASGILEGSGSKVGYRQQNSQLQAAIEDEEKLRDRVVAALTSEVENRQGEYESYLETRTKNEKETSAHLNKLVQLTLFMIKARTASDDTLIKVQNERNERIRVMHEYVKNMNQIEDLNQQIIALQKRARSLTIDQKERPVE